MIQAKQDLNIKKVVYFGKINEDIKHLRDGLKSRWVNGVSWLFEVVSDRLVFASRLRQSRFDLILLDVSSDVSSTLNLLEMIERDAPLSGVIGVAGYNPGHYAPLILSRRIHDIVDLRQDHGEIVQIMAACVDRQKVSKLQSVDSTNRRPSAVRWGGTTMAKVATRIPNIVNSAISCIHITGESGTGKELVAQMFRETVGDAPFVALSCATIPESLMEATLFGSVRGAYTGATKDLKGVFEEADGGWIFLDEVGCLSRGAQAALLRAIENQEVTPIGENRSKKLNFRVISATNASLREMTKSGEFRLDLYNRLAEVEIYLPPLRERRDELPDLIQCLVETLPHGPYRLSAAARRLLETHPWADGNARQLRNCLRAMTEFHVEGTLTPLGIPRKVLEEACDSIKSSVPQSQPFPVTDSGQGSGNHHGDLSKHGLWVRVAFSESEEIDFDRMSLELFAQVAKAVAVRNGRFSARDLAAALNVSRSTISRRINEAIEQGIGDFDTLMA